jgi:apolipoprotein N-acyltransferase
MKSFIERIKKIMAKRALYPLFTYILILLASPYTNIWILAWCAFIPLFIFLRDEKKIWKIILFPSFGYFLMYSVSAFGFFHYSPVDYLIFSVFISFMIAPFMVLAKYFFVQSERLGPYLRSFFLILGIPAALTLYEFVRGSSPVLRMMSGGFLATTQVYNLPMLQVASLIGVYGLTFIVLVCNSALFLFFFPLSKKEKKKERLIPVVALCILALLFVWGLVRASRNYRENESLRVTLLQPNISLEPFNERESAFMDVRDIEPGSVEDILFELYEKGAHERADLIIFPERSFPSSLAGPLASPLADLLRTTIEREGIATLVGAIYEPNENETFNSAYFISGNGEILDRYDKMVLFPIGEYVPGGYYLEELVNDLGVHKRFPMVFTGQPTNGYFSLRYFINADWINPGTRHTIFSDPRGFQFATLICAEDVFPSLTREFALRDIDFMVAMINDAWFEEAVTTDHHFAFTILRAVENNVAFVRATNTAFSGLILPNGKVGALFSDAEGRKKNARGFLTVSLPLTRERTFFTRFGHTFPYWISALVVFFLIAPLFFKKSAA